MKAYFRSKRIKYLLIIPAFVVAGWACMHAYRVNCLHDLVDSGAELLANNNIVRKSNYSLRLSLIASLHGVDFIDMKGCSIDVGVCRSISAFPESESIVLADTNINDSFAKFIGGLGSLKNLSVAGTSIGNKFIAGLANHDCIERLNISRTNVNNDGLKHIAEFGKLRIISLNELDINDEFIGQLASLRIEEIELRNTLVTESGISKIDLGRIVRLNVSGTLVSGAGEWYHAMSALRSANVSHTEIDASDIAKLVKQCELRSLVVDASQIGEWIMQVEESDLVSQFSITIVGNAQEIKNAYEHIESIGFRLDHSFVRLSFVECK